MVDEKIANEEPNLDDLPPRTWRLWWLAWPKWFRVGCLGIIGVYAVPALGICAWLIYVRLAEPAAIQSLRRSGVMVQCEYDRLGQIPGFIVPYIRLRNAFKTRKNADVHFVIFKNHPTTDADLELIARSFPNLTELTLKGEAYNSPSLRQLRRCSKLEHLQLGDAELDHDTIQQLLKLKNLAYYSRLDLYAQKLDLISRENPAPTQPGTYEFTLSNNAYGAITLNESTINLPFMKTFYFRITEAQHFNAQLDHAGSDAVIMSFMGDDEGRTHRTQKYTRQGEILTISADITQADLEKLGDRCWKLKVANRAQNSTAKCKLTITIEDPEP